MTPKKIVSLIPSETYNLAYLNALSSLVGRTRYCIEPPEVMSVPAVGGTKDLDIDAILALEPDLILANKEENRRDDVLPLIHAGLNVRVTCPSTVQEGFDDLIQLSELLSPPLSPPLSLPLSLPPSPPLPSHLRCFVPIWKDPFMTVSGATYLGDVIRWLGWTNPFEEQEDRYPVVSLEQILSAQPQVVLLPDEPYAFGPEHRAFFEKLDIPAARHGAIALVNGRDLCWHGAWAFQGLERLKQVSLRLTACHRTIG